MTIEVTAWAPDQATAQAFMVEVGIAEIVDGEFVPSLVGNIDEIGPIVKVPAETDADGNIVTPAVVIAGHHVNVRFAGESADALTDGLPQTDGDGNLLSLFERTHILDMVSQRTGQPMTWEPLALDGVPPGYVNAAGVRLFDPAVINSRARVWQ